MVKTRLATLTKSDTIVTYEQKVSPQNGDHPDLVNWVLKSKQWYKDHVRPFTACCNHDGLRGDFNGDGACNVADLTSKVDYLLFNGQPPSCREEGDDTGDDAINIVDLTYEVDYLFFNGPPPVACP